MRMGSLRVLAFPLAMGICAKPSGQVCETINLPADASSGL